MRRVVVAAAVAATALVSAAPARAQNGAAQNPSGHAGSEGPSSSPKTAADAPTPGEAPPGSKVHPGEAPGKPSDAPPADKVDGDKKNGGSKESEKKDDDKKKEEEPGTSTRQEPGKTPDHGGGPARSTTPDRALPEYDGRGSYTTTGEVLLWIPRILLSPLYLLTEYAIRRPLGAGISAAEEANLPKVLYDFFAFGPDHKSGILPTVLVDFGFRPSVGFLAFWNDVGGSGHDVQLHGSTFGTDWLAAGLIDRYHLSTNPSDVFTTQFSVIDRPDKAFFGMGPRSLQGNLSRYGLTTLDGGFALDWKFHRTSTLHAAVGDTSYNFHRGHLGDDPTVDDSINAGRFGPPAGWDHGYSEIYSRLALGLDSRQTSGTGVRLDLDGEYDADVTHHPGQGWVKYGATAGALFDLTGHKRILSFSATALFADPLGSGITIPFLDQVTLGGYGPMKGLYPGRLYDRSAAVGEIAYHWPLWILVDGTIRGEIGNVFGDHLSGFDANLLRLSGSIGVQTVGLPGNTLELLFGVGTETFEHGTQVDSFRLYVGGTNGF